jgi:hypothetical protein
LAARTTIVLIGAALFIIGYLTVAVRGQSGPMTGLMSDYLYHGPGGPLFATAILLMVLGGLACGRRNNAQKSTVDDLHRAYLPIFAVLMRFGVSTMVVATVMPSPPG